MIIETILTRGNTGICQCKCDYCTKEFIKDKAKATLSKHHFCCRECRYKWFVGANNVNSGKPMLAHVKQAIIKANTGRHPHNFKGRKICRGYVRVYKPEHPNSDNTGYIYEHRLIMEASIGRYLYPYEIVHHINGIKDDNRIENLELLPNNSLHNKKVQEVYLENQRLKEEIKELKLALS